MRQISRSTLGPLDAKEQLSGARTQMFGGNMNEQNGSKGTNADKAFNNSILRGRWETSILPTASILALPSGPGNYLTRRSRSAPSGWPALFASLALAIRGMLEAFTKHHWREISNFKGDIMKPAINSRLESQSYNRESVHSISVKEKPKTVYIKLHPKPNAPRHSGITLQNPRFGTR